MKRLYIALFLPLAMLFPAFGQRLMTLEECIDSAVSRNPALNAAALEVEKARIMKGTAFDAPFTDIILKQETTGGGGPENGVSFSQEFDFPTVYVSRRRMLEAAYNVERHRFGLQTAATVSKVEGAFYSLLYRRELLRINGELGEIYDQFLKVAAVRYKEGEGSALEVMNAERMVEKNRLERNAVEMDLAADMARLKNLTYCSEDILPAETGLWMIPFEGSADFDFTGTLRGAEARERIKLAEKDVALAKNQFLPGITVGATVQALIKGFNPYHIERERFRPGNLMGIEVGISVPLFFGAHSARLKAAHAERAAAVLRGEYAEAEAAGEVKALTARIEALAGQVRHLKEVSVPRADEIRRLAEVSYGLGEIDYLEYIANLETAYSVYRDLADKLNEYNQNVIQIKEITSDTEYK